MANDHADRAWLDSQKTLSATSFGLMKKSSLLSGIIAGLREVDRAIQNHDGHVNAGRPERARHGLREDTLRGLGGRESRRPRHPSQGRRGADE